LQGREAATSVKASSAETALNAKNLAGLGAERLAELLMELGAGDASIKRRLHMELAAASGSANVARSDKTSERHRQGAYQARFRTGLYGYG
jgi:hypothetical protein